MAGPAGAEARQRVRSALQEFRPREAPVILPVLMILSGGYLMWFGVKYWRGQGPAVWPSYPIKSVLQGHGLPPNGPATTAEVQLTAYETQLGQQSQGQGQGGGTPAAGGGPVPSGQPQHIARLLLPRYGWDATQMTPLISLWTRESGWNPQARNPTSGAFGIAQALGHGESGTAAPDGTNEYGAQYGLSPEQARQANAGNAGQQIRWGLGYIKSRYQTPSGAWTHETGFGWY